MGWFKTEVIIEVDAEKLEALQAEVDGLRETKRELTETNKGLVQDHQLATQKIAHNVTIKTEQLELQHEKNQVELERKSQEKITEIRQNYASKVEADLKQQIEKGDKQFKEILTRLPNVNVALNNAFTDE